MTAIKKSIGKPGRTKNASRINGQQAAVFLRVQASVKLANMTKHDIVNIIKRAFDKTPMPAPENVMHG